MATKEFERIFLLLVIAAVSKVAQGEACVKMCDRGTLCVTRYVLCDGLSDCQDLADEANCKVDDCDGLTCPDGKCIRNDQYCDGHIDCTDQTDEIGCTKENYRQNHPSLTDEELCMRPCEYGKCKFDENFKSVCVCLHGFIGAFCEINVFDKPHKGPEVVVYTHNGSEREIISRPKISESERFPCESPQGYVYRQLVCNGRFECDDRRDESNCTRIDYKRLRSDPPEANLCVMPCDHGVCKFDAKDFAFCKCKTNFRGLFCEIQSVPKIETTTDLRFSDNYDESTTLEYRHKMLVSAIESVPRVDDPVEHQTGLLPQVNVGDTLWPKSELDDPLSKNEAGESSVVSVVVTFLIVVAGVGVLLWTLVLKPCYKQQYDNTV